jgi:hypothetical protein
VGETGRHDADEEGDAADGDDAHVEGADGQAVALD